MIRTVLTAISLLIVLTGCQGTGASTTPDPDRSFSSEETRQREVAIRAMKVHCADKWRGDAGMVAYCEKTQMPALISFIKKKTIFEESNKKTKGAAWKDEVAYYSKCQTTYWGDYEMALACADTERQVKILSRN